MVGQAPVQSVGNAEQHAQVVTVGNVVPFNFHISVRHGGQSRVEGGGVVGQFTRDVIDGRAKAHRNAIVEGVADGGLNGDNLHHAGDAFV